MRDWMAYTSLFLVNLFIATGLSLAVCLPAPHVPVWPCRCTTPGSPRRSAVSRRGARPGRMRAARWGRARRTHRRRTDGSTTTATMTRTTTSSSFLDRSGSSGTKSIRCSARAPSGRYSSHCTYFSFYLIFSPIFSTWYGCAPLSVVSENICTGTKNKFPRIFQRIIPVHF